MDIARDKICDFITRVKAIDAKEEMTDPDSGSNPTDDGNRDVLTMASDDPTEEELREFIAALNDDEAADIVALIYIGRGDMEPEEWGDAVRLARERIAVSRVQTADYLLGIPNLGDLLDEGLAAFGEGCE